MSEPNKEALTVELVLEAIYIDNGEVVRTIDSPKLFVIKDSVSLGGWTFKGLRGTRLLLPVANDASEGLLVPGDMQIVWCATKDKATKFINADKCQRQG